MTGQGEEALQFPDAGAHRLAAYLPPPHPDVSALARPFVTLTFATSLDSALSLARGVRTALSGRQSKAMTHFLRTKHAAILVGVGTAEADDPGLNSRLIGEHSQPRPVVLDPHARWHVTAESKMVQLARTGLGLGPLVLVAEGSRIDAERAAVLDQVGGRYLQVQAGGNGYFQWTDVLDVLQAEGLGSVMVEGGGTVINSLLTWPNSGLVDSVIVTVAPTWLGQGGVVVSPPRTAAPPLRLKDVLWHPLGDDVVLSARIRRP